MSEDIIKPLSARIFTDFGYFGYKRTECYTREHGSQQAPKWGPGI